MGIKKYIILFLLCFAVRVQGQISLVMDNTLQNCPQMGVLLSNAGSTTAAKAHILKDTLNSRCVRFEIEMQGYSGTSAAYGVYTDSGLQPHVVIGVDSVGVDPQPWITSLADLATSVNSLLTTYPAIRILVLDNEEFNTSYHTGDLFDYTRIADTIHHICQLNHVLLANGGFGNFFAINQYTFRWLKSHYNQDTADAFAARVFTNGVHGSQYANANTPGTNPTLEAWQTRMDTIMTCLSFDIINWHNYQPEGDSAYNPNTITQCAPNVWRFYCEALKNGNTNKRRQVMCNETGQRYNTKGDLTTNMLISGFALGLLYFDYWSGNGVALGATPLTADDGTINETGIAFRNYVNGTFP
jgi:hypothetical protein